MELDEAIKGRRSVRVFKDKPIEDRLLTKILKNAMWAPSACNQQAWNFIIIKDKNTTKLLVNEAASTGLIKNAPVLIAVTYEKENLKPEYLSQSASAAVQNLLLTAYQEGLGACWLTGIGSEKKIKKILEIPDNQLVICFVILGYAKREQDTPPRRKSFKDVVHKEKFTENQGFPVSHNPENWTLDQIKKYSEMTSSKTEPGTVMDLANDRERALISKILPKEEVGIRVLDLFSYDGSFLNCFHQEAISNFELSVSCADYTKTKSKPELLDTHYFEELDVLTNSKRRFDCITCLFKLERFPRKERLEFMQKFARTLKTGGTFTIAFRKKNSLYGGLYWFLKKLFGDNIKKTALYPFFGPYEPLSTREVTQMCQKTSLTVSKSDNYFLIPPVIEELAQLGIQYFKSEKTNFVHRKHHFRWYTKLIKKVLDWQGLRKSRFGSVCVMRLKRWK